VSSFSLYIFFPITVAVAFVYLAEISWRSDALFYATLLWGLARKPTNRWGKVQSCRWPDKSRMVLENYAELF